MVYLPRFIYHSNEPNVGNGIYTSPMDAMGFAKKSRQPPKFHG